MILNALDEVLYWENIELLKAKMSELFSKYYPHNPEKYFNEKEKFYNETIPDRKEFLRRIEYYSKNGNCKWVSGRSILSNDITEADLRKAILNNCKLENGQKKARMAEKIIDKDLDFWNFYSGNVLYTSNNTVLELTIGAGLGTAAVMRNMKDSDLYIGADIDFLCAKNADAIAKYYDVNGLGLVTSLWNMPFDDAMFTAVCCNAGLEECREITVIIKEAVRVLLPKGRLVFHCIDIKKNNWRMMFNYFGFTDEETDFWLRKVRLYSDISQIEEYVFGYGMRLLDKKYDKEKGYVLVFEKQ